MADSVRWLPRVRSYPHLPYSINYHVTALIRHVRAVYDIPRLERKKGLTLAAVVYTYPRTSTYLPFCHNWDVNTFTAVNQRAEHNGGAGGGYNTTYATEASGEATKQSRLA